MATPRKSHANLADTGRKSMAASGGRPSMSHRKSHSHHHEHQHHFTADDLHYRADIEKEKREGDLSGQWGKIVFCRRHFHSMTPMRIIFHICGRFPFSTQLEADGYYSYSFMWYYPGTVYFLIALCAIIAVMVLGLISMAHVTLNSTIFMDFNKTDPVVYEGVREFENILIIRYFVPLIFVYASILHGCISGILILFRRHYITHYLTFWSRAVHTLHMDVSSHALTFSITVLIIFVVVVSSISLLAVFKVGSTPIGLPTVFGDLTVRFLVKKKDWLLNENKTRGGVQLFGAFFLIYAFTASKVSILFIIYHFKTLQTAFAHWNGRVYAAVLRGGEFAQTEEGRTTYKLLFKDHCILMDLVEGLDKISSWITESYFGCQVFSLFFEIYFVIRTAKNGDNAEAAAYPEEGVDAFFVRPKDWAAGLIMLFVSISIMVSTIRSAANLSEEAMAGLEVLRRKTMLGRKTDDELYFSFSMFSSYTAYKKIEICAGGYFYMNKDFLIGCISSVLSYFIILYQFQPVMDLSFPNEGETKDKRVFYGKLLANLEDVKLLNHYILPRAWTTIIGILLQIHSMFGKNFTSK